MTRQHSDEPASPTGDGGLVRLRLDLAYDGVKVETGAKELKQLDDANAKFQAISDKDVAAVNVVLVKAKLEVVKLLSKEDWNKKQQ